MPRLRLTPLLVLIAVPLGCPPPVDGGDAGAPESAITIDDEPYRVGDAPRLLIHMGKATSAGLCGAAHGHAISAPQFSLQGSVSSSSPGESVLTLTVPAQLLIADAPEDRALFADIADEPLSDADRARIQASMPPEVSNEEHPNLVIEMTNLSALAAGTQTVDAKIVMKGLEEEFPLTFDLAQDGEAWVFSNGTGVIRRSRFDILGSNPFGGCLDDEMDFLVLELRLIPGAQADGDLDAGPGFVPQSYPYTGDCVAEGGYDDELFGILGRRCLGCHEAASDFPLVQYEDWFWDSPSEPGRPRWEAAWDLMMLPDDDSVHMPPLAAATQLSDEELGLAFAWFEAGAPDNCGGFQAPPLFDAVPASMSCGSPNFDEDVAPMISTNFCVVCHDGQNPDVAVLTHEDFTSGTPDADHPFYAPLSRWEASVERIRDGTMPPLEGFGAWVPTGADLAADLVVLDAWIAAGYPESPCP